jgi:hypothetical protein
LYGLYAAVGVVVLIVLGAVGLHFGRRKLEERL